MIATDPEQIAKQPKWVQNLVRNLERRIQDLEHEVALNSGPETSNITIETHVPLGPVKVRDDCPLRFHALKQDKRDRWIEVGFNINQIDEHQDRRGEGLRIYGDDSLAVEPKASNVVVVRLVR